MVEGGGLENRKGRNAAGVRILPPASGVLSESGLWCLPAKKVSANPAPEVQILHTPLKQK